LSLELTFWSLIWIFQLRKPHTKSSDTGGSLTLFVAGQLQTVIIMWSFPVSLWLRWNDVVRLDKGLSHKDLPFMLWEMNVFETLNVQQFEEFNTWWCAAPPSLISAGLTEWWWNPSTLSCWKIQEWIVMITGAFQCPYWEWHSHPCSEFPRNETVMYYGREILWHTKESTALICDEIWTDQMTNCGTYSETCLAKTES
jgi:hypothetical protein